MGIVGIDEVGRGPWAGPVVACALVLHREIAGIADSKTLSAKARLLLTAALREPGVATFGLGAASAAEIDRLNIRQATFLAMRRALARLPVRPGRILVDGRDAPDLGVETEAVIGGDRTVAAIAAASILAKTCRDGLMVRLDARHPGYGWARNVGYGTAAHALALDRLGVTPHHRVTFKPVRARLEAAAPGWAAPP
ncbi:MAG: ribonuclease HII [Geminicoccaceae bacterium]|nr:MAG: ribonuclease HII [Geminicoccaceae bacterium]